MLKPEFYAPMFNILHFPFAGIIVAIYLYINNDWKESLFGERDRYISFFHNRKCLFQYIYI